MMGNYRSDVEYEVWRSGHSPDRLSPDRIEQHQWDGHSAEEAAAAEMRRWETQARDRRQQQEAEEAYYLQGQMEEDQRREEERNCPGTALEWLSTFDPQTGSLSTYAARNCGYGDMVMAGYVVNRGTSEMPDLFITDAGRAVLSNA